MVNVVVWHMSRLHSIRSNRDNTEFSPKNQDWPIKLQRCRLLVLQMARLLHLRHIKGILYMTTQPAERFGIEFVSPLTNFRERDGDPSDTFVDAIARAEAKATGLITLSGARLAVLDRIQDDAARKYTILLGFTQGGRSTGTFIEVGPIAPGRSGLAINIRGGLEDLAI